MRSMRIDCAPVRISSWDELVAYMDGSAGSVGRIMAALLGVPARHHSDLGRLGLAFQLANFIRDVREDRRLDRVYLPSEDRERFGVSEDDLAADVATPEVRALVAHEVERARGLFAGARPAIASAPASVRPGVRFATGLYTRMLDRVEATDFDVLGGQDRRPRLAHPGAARRGDPRVTRRATLRGAARTDITQRADVLICGASFAGLAVARELAGSGADVLVVDRYEIGERATSACAAPTPWLHAMGVQSAIRQEIPCMAFHTPHGSARFRLPWSWSSFDYKRLCQALWEQTDARFEIAKVQARDGDTVLTDRGNLTSPLIVDALGWRRVLGPGANVQPPEAAISRGLEVHPHGASTDLDIWIDRSLIRHGYAWSVPADGEQRVGVGSYQPRDHVKEPTKAIAQRLDRDAVRYQGNWFPHKLRPAAEDGVFFAGDSAGHCIPLSGEGIRTAFYFGIAAGRELRATLAGDQDARAGAARLRRVLPRPRAAFTYALALQRAIPRLPPRALTALLAVMGRERPCRRAFDWYLRVAPPP